MKEIHLKLTLIFSAHLLQRPILIENQVKKKTIQQSTQTAPSTNHRVKKGAENQTATREHKHLKLEAGQASESLLHQQKKTRTKLKGACKTFSSNSESCVPDGGILFCQSCYCRTPSAWQERHNYVRCSPVTQSTGAELGSGPETRTYDYQQQ